MSDMSCSEGFVRLENGVLIDLDSPPPLHAIEDERMQAKVRDEIYEKEFQGAIGRRVVDVRFDHSLLYILIEEGWMISILPAQFWVRPCLERDEAINPDARSVWQTKDAEQDVALND